MQQTMSQWRWLEVLFVMSLLPVGSILGALTGIVALSAIFAVVLPLIAATFFLYQDGVSWRDIGLFKTLTPGRLLSATLTALVCVHLLAYFVVTPIMLRLGAPPTNISVFSSLIEDNLVNYLIFLIPVAWGSAAIGEEMLCRGYLIQRLGALTTDAVAVVLQAGLFALAHLYQGMLGVANIFILAIVFGIVYLRCGRSLIPLIIAHGVIDTIAITLIYLGYSEFLVGADA